MLLYHINSVRKHVILWENSSYIRNQMENKLRPHKKCKIKKICTCWMEKSNKEKKFSTRNRYTVFETKTAFLLQQKSRIRLTASLSET